jgi:hypothetical protein
MEMTITLTPDDLAAVDAIQKYHGGTSTRADAVKLAIHKHAKGLRVDHMKLDYPPIPAAHPEPPRGPGREHYTGAGKR